MKLFVLLAAFLATAHAACNFGKILYNPAPIVDLNGDKVDTDVHCAKGAEEIIATDYTQNYNAIAKKLLTSVVFKSFTNNDQRDTYDCGSDGIKRANVKGIAGCLAKGTFHGDVCIQYVCNNQARIRTVCVDGAMKLKGNC